jgi:hypothetical protein
VAARKRGLRADWFKIERNAARLGRVVQHFPQGPSGAKLPILIAA